MENKIIKCSNLSCKSETFILLSSENGPVMVNNKGEQLSPRMHIYKCAECSSMTKSLIGPQSSPKLIKG